MYYQPLGSFDSWTRDSIGNLLNPYTGSSGRDDVWKALQDLDAGTEPDTVNLIYSEQDVKGSDHGTATTWNREHLWPKSHEVGQNGADFTDIHHLRPADWNVNSARSNLYFGACGLVQEILKCQIPARSQAANDTSNDSSVFFPLVNRRGDVARALFYMDLRYFGGAGDVDLELTDCPRPDNDNQMAYLSQLLEWHIADEVDEPPQQEWTFAVHVHCISMFNRFVDSCRLPPLIDLAPIRNLEIRVAAMIKPNVR
jgi:endonuclease I